MTKIRNIIESIKNSYKIITAEKLDDELEQECRDAFLRFLDNVYYMCLGVFAVMGTGSLYFFVTRVILSNM